MMQQQIQHTLTQFKLSISHTTREMQFKRQHNCARGFRAAAHAAAGQAREFERKFKNKLSHDHHMYDLNHELELVACTQKVRIG